MAHCANSKPKGVLKIILSNYNDNLQIEQVDQMEESEINYGYTRKRNYIECETLGYCPICNKRLTILDDIYPSDGEPFCSEKCIKALESESA